ncbi:glycosyltransferase [Gracilibacillus sp. JCM 18860]|uniref:glycosyltransferase n=1 Tax=Gracilibacillus sp. JCM 18860 TaxID=1306159 RepID=UPI0006D1706D
MLPFFLTISNLCLQKKKKYDDLNKLIELYSGFALEKQRAFYVHFKNYISRSKMPFVEKMSFFSVLVKLGGIKDRILQDMMDELKNDQEHIQYHYPFLINSLFNVSKERVQKYPDIISDRMNIMDRIVNFYRHKISTCYPDRTSHNHKELKRIAIVATQLLGLKHSPTLLVLTIAKYLKKLDQNIEITIFVDDTYIYCQEEFVYPNLYSSTPSQKLKNIHDEFLKDFNVTIKYTNYLLNRQEKLQNEINEIIEFQPDVIYLMGADFSLRSWVLAKAMPVVVMSMSPPEPSSFVNATLYTSMHNEKFVESQYEKINVNKKRQFKQVIHANQLPVPFKNIRRLDLAFDEKDFIMVTAGNRLDGDIDIQFVRIIKKFLKETKSIKWLLVGNAEHRVVHKEMQEEIINNQITFITYEDDLQSLLKICDIYVNPFCEGNGRIGRMAMNMRLPIISHNESSDISEIIGEEFTIDKSMYFDRLKYYYFNKERRIYDGQVMYEKEQLKNPINWAKQIIEIFNEIILKSN